MAGRFTTGTCKEDIWACILARPCDAPSRDATPLIYEQVVIEMANPEPTVLTRADARTMIRWHLRAAAEGRGRSIPPADLEKHVDEIMTQFEAGNLGGAVSGSDTRLIEKLRATGRRQKSRRNGICECGSGKKFKRCCYHRN